MVVVKKGDGPLGLGTLKSTVYKFRKGKSYFNNHWVGMVKNGQGLVDHGTPKPGVYLTNDLMH